MRLLLLRRIIQPARRIEVKNRIEYWYEETPYYDIERKKAGPPQVKIFWQK